MDTNVPINPLLSYEAKQGVGRLCACGGRVVEHDRLERVAREVTVSEQPRQPSCRANATADENEGYTDRILAIPELTST